MSQEMKILCWILVAGVIAGAFTFAIVLSPAGANGVAAGPATVPASPDLPEMTAEQFVRGVPRHYLPLNDFVSASEDELQAICHWLASQSQFVVMIDPAHASKSIIRDKPLPANSFSVSYNYDLGRHFLGKIEIDASASIHLFRGETLEVAERAQPPVATRSSRRVERVTAWPVGNRIFLWFDLSKP